MESSDGVVQSLLPSEESFLSFFRFLGLFVVFQQIRYLFFILGNFWSFLLSKYEKIGKKGQRTGERKQKKRMRRGGKRKGQPLSGLSLALRG